MSPVYLFLIFIFGGLLLWKSGDWSVISAVRFSEIFQIHGFIIGFLIFAMATNFPEIISAIVSSLEKVPEFSSGDLIGSTFVNLTLQLGIASIIAKKLPIEIALRNHLTRNIAFIFAVLTLLIFFSHTNIFLGIIITLVYFFSWIWLPKISKPFERKEMSPVHFQFFSPKIDVIIKLICSLILLVFSAWLTVTSAIKLAKTLHIPIEYIGATLMAVSTSLPELTLEIHAIKRKEYGLALGDIFGSAMLNISLILGLLFTFNPSFPLILPKIIYPFFIPVMAFIAFRRFGTFYFTRCDGSILIALFILYTLRIALSL